ncbi:MAG: DUF262 domain-containing protein [Acidimicrobiia bacterium]|nr:DUF262 domain-containing protein [Acidimicrobiia bacterium]MYJ63375.1 DUF262 domain-containing protein [Acidimicrobiia bacterium]
MDLNLDTKVIGIGTLLLQNHFNVPRHQRSYAWTESEVSDLWNDTIQALSDEPGGYFLGQIVLGEGEDPDNRRQIIDGQQRLATITLIFAGIASLLRERDEGDESNIERAEVYISDFISKKDRSSLQNTYRVCLSTRDNSFFEELLLSAAEGTTLPEPGRESHKQLIEAYNFLKTEINRYAPTKVPDWLERLGKLTDYICERLFVITVMARSNENAFLIFETLNDRGMQLTPADLIKNLLYSLSGDRIEEIQHSWDSMVATLETISDDPPVTQFIRHYWISTRGSVRDKQLYKVIKSEITTGDDAITFTAALTQAAKLYVAITIDDSKTWKSEQDREAIRVIGLYRSHTIRPLLLAIGDMRHSQKRTDLIQQVMRSTIRLAIAGRLGSGSVEEGAGSAARSVRSGGVTSPAKLVSVLGRAHISDADFEAAFNTYSVNNGRRARYLLRALENLARSKSSQSPELVAINDESIVNLEHILPRNPESGSWTHFSADDARVFANRLGNQVLMRSDVNSVLGNGEYSEKEEALSTSDLELTKIASGLAEWTILEIDRRQQHLAKLAVELW